MTTLMFDDISLWRRLAFLELVVDARGEPDLNALCFTLRIEKSEALIMLSQATQSSTSEIRF